MAKTGPDRSKNEGVEANTTPGESSAAREYQPLEIDDTMPLGLRRALERVEARRRQRFDSNESPTPPDTDETARGVESPVVDLTSKLRSQSIRSKIKEVEATLQQQVDQGNFNAYPLRADNAFPTLLARLPIFRPSRPSTQRQKIDRHNALPFRTSFGEGKRYGPFLTVYDEDVLIALMRLRTQRIYGQPHRLPVALQGQFEGEGGRVGVDAVVCSESEVIRELGIDDSGKSYRRVRESIKHIASTSLELNFDRHEKYLGPVQKGGVIQLLHVQWELYESDGVYVVIFPPAVSMWLQNQCTFLNWEIRKQLDPLGKCLHRFLESQPKRYAGEVKKIAETVGYDGDMRNVRQRFTKALNGLVATGWLQSYHFSGNGRKHPLRLHIQR